MDGTRRARVRATAAAATIVAAAVATGWWAPAYAMAPPAVSALSPGAGPAGGGTAVTISGSGLQLASSVEFGATPAQQFSVRSDAAIVATAPPGTGTVDVTVASPAGTSALSPADRFTYATVPAVTAVLPAAGDTSGGGEVTIAGSGFGAATGVDFGQYAAAFTVVSDGEIDAVAPSGTAGTVDVTVWTPAGQSAATSADRFTYMQSPSVDAVSPTLGGSAGGTPVRIAGSGFTGATTVLFGSVPSTFTTLSNNLIVATAPPGTGTVAVTVSKLPGPAAVAAGPAQAYAVMPDGTVWAWGAGAVGAAGQDQAAAPLPHPLQGLPPIRQIAVGAATVYALAQDGMVWAWSAGAGGTFGQSLFASRPARVSGIAGVTAVAAGGGTAYALVQGGTVWAWGGDAFGQTGRPTRDACLCTARPVRVPGLGDVTAIAAGDDTGYALRADGSIWAWGAGGSGQLGRGSLPAAGAPAPVPGLAGATAIAAGGESAYAVAGGAVWAWGAGGSGQMGDGGLLNAQIPSAVQGLPATATPVSVAAGRSTGYALLADGSLWAWGADGDGQAGQAVADSQCGCVLQAAAVAGVAGAAAIAAGPTSAYALAGAGVWAWGDGAAGQLGLPGLATATAAPAAVAGFWAAASGPGAAAQFSYLPVPVVTAVRPDAGAAGGGTAVAIYGQGFAGVTQVLFGDRPAQGLDVVSATEITTTAPPGTGTVDVTAAGTGGGSAAVPADRYAYTEAPP